jgi:hypothetical protein
MELMELVEAAVSSPTIASVVPSSDEREDEGNERSCLVRRLDNGTREEEETEADNAAPPPDCSTARGLQGTNLLSIDLEARRREVRRLACLGAPVLAVAGEDALRPFDPAAAIAVAIVVADCRRRHSEQSESEQSDDASPDDDDEDELPDDDDDDELSEEVECCESGEARNRCVKVARPRPLCHS